MIPFNFNSFTNSPYPPNASSIRTLQEATNGPDRISPSTGANTLQHPNTPAYASDSAAPVLSSVSSSTTFGQNPGPRAQTTVGTTAPPASSDGPPSLIDGTWSPTEELDDFMPPAVGTPVMHLTPDLHAAYQPNPQYPVALAGNFAFPGLLANVPVPLPPAVLVNGPVPPAVGNMNFPQFPPFHHLPQAIPRPILQGLGHPIPPPMPQLPQPMQQLFPQQAIQPTLLLQPPDPPAVFATIVFDDDLLQWADYEKWTEEEKRSKRRIVEFHIQHTNGNRRIIISSNPVSQEEWKPSMTTVSCIYWHPDLSNGMKDFTPRYVFTSVEIIRLLEQIVIASFDTKEKNRVRRNLENCGPVCIRKDGDTKLLSNVILSYKHPKVVNISKEIKVFQWSQLNKCVKKVISMYNVNPPQSEDDNDAQQGENVNA